MLYLHEGELWIGTYTQFQGNFEEKLQKGTAGTKTKYEHHTLKYE